MGHVRGIDRSCDQDLGDFGKAEGGWGRRSCCGGVGSVGFLALALKVSGLGADQEVPSRRSSGDRRLALKEPVPPPSGQFLP